MPMTPSQQPSPPTGEQTTLSWPLIGFYTSCALVALGATIAAASWMWSRSVGGLVAGSVLTIASSVTCLTCLRRARRE
ncbi:MAG: hypothetical protein RIT25_175 [Planctomycetota bacterium]|jgi:hypothetical protein